MARENRKVISPFVQLNWKQKSPMMLFHESDLGLVTVPKISTNMSPQLKLFDRDLFDNESNASFFATPPKEKFVTTPKAPVKNKIGFKKGLFKPKTLRYTEDELNVPSTVNSGMSNSLSLCNDTLSYKQYTVESNKFDSSQKQTRTLRSTVGKTNIQADGIENDSGVLSYASNAINNVPQSAQSSLVDVQALSFYDNDNGDWKDVLNWLQPRRDIGLWIQCCRKRCQKWRYTEDYHDPVNVPKVWYCEMNSDKTIANCNIPEKPIPDDINEDLIENSYNAGSIVWAHIRGYPWWPGIVSDCPMTFQYYKLHKTSLRPIQYFVTFFNEDKLECAWIDKKDLKSFASTPYHKIIKKTVFHRTDYKSSLDAAHQIALSLIPLSISERLERFSYLAQYNKFYDDNNNSQESINANLSRDTSFNDIVPSSPTENRMSLKEYYLNVICRR